MSSNTALRTLLREKRRALSNEIRDAAAHAVCKQVLALPLFQKSQHIALYMPFDGELDTRPLVQACLKAQKSVYLPIITDTHMLQFAPFQLKADLTPNRFGILEPTTPVVPLTQLDIVFTPLLAFQPAGQRLGLGGGYYDRTFAMKQSKPHAMPTLIGLAYTWQGDFQFETHTKDVTLDGIITDTHCD